MVPEQEDEGQTAETLPAVASPSRRPAGCSSNGPCLSLLHSTVPLHAPSPPTPPSPPPLPPGSLLAGILSSQSVQRTHEDPGCFPSVPVPQQTRGAAPRRRRPVPLQQLHAPPRLLPLPALSTVGTRAAAQGQRGGTGTEPASESQSQHPARRSGEEGGDGVAQDGLSASLSNCCQEAAVMNSSVLTVIYIDTTHTVEVLDNSTKQTRHNHSSKHPILWSYRNFYHY